MKPNAIGKKSPNRLRKPKASIRIPNTGHPHSTSSIPPRKVLVPRAFFFWKKNRYVFDGPIMSVMPERKRSCAARGRGGCVSAAGSAERREELRTLPMASSPLSKNSMIPITEKSTPPAVRPMPIFRESSIVLDGMRPGKGADGWQPVRTTRVDLLWRELFTVRRTSRCRLRAPYPALAPDTRHIAAPDHSAAICKAARPLLAGEALALGAGARD
eukprot:gene11844-biopygen7708